MFQFKWDRSSQITFIYLHSANWSLFIKRAGKPPSRALQ